MDLRFTKYRPKKYGICKYKRNYYLQINTNKIDQDWNKLESITNNRINFTLMLQNYNTQRKTKVYYRILKSDKDQNLKLI